MPEAGYVFLWHAEPRTPSLIRAKRAQAEVTSPLASDGAMRSKHYQSGWLPFFSKFLLLSCSFLRPRNRKVRLSAG